MFDGEHLFEQFFAFFGLGLEELRELTLRQEYDFEELFFGQVGTFGDGAVDFGDAAGDGGPGFFVGGVGAGCEFGEGCFGAFFAHLAFAGAAGDGLVVGGGAIDAQALAVEGHVEQHARFGAAVCRVGGVQFGGFAVAAGFAVEGVADGVEDGGFTGAGGAVEEEYAGVVEGVEVDFLALGICHEGFEFEVVQDHALSLWLLMWSLRVVMTSRSSLVRGRLRTYWWNWSKVSTGSASRVRGAATGLSVAGWVLR